MGLGGIVNSLKSTVRSLVQHPDVVNGGPKSDGIKDTVKDVIGTIFSTTENKVTDQYHHPELL